MPDRILKKVEYIRVNGGFSTARERIVRETALSIYIDRQPFATAMMLATMEKEFVIGHLFGQGIIGSVKDIKSIIIKDNVADVVLAEKTSGRKEISKARSDLKVSRDDVFSCVRAILKSDVFAETEAVHSAGLFLQGREAVCIAEDLGRHNALDKVVGYGLLKNVDFGNTLVASTGRQPSEMIMRCRNAGIPILATKGVPTTLGVENAVAAGITIAGLVRGSTMTVYSHPSRIE
jgi:FdhD protein